MVAGSFYIPKSNKAPLGEDAHFIYIEEEAIGVADGIGCWAKKDRRVVIRDGVIVYKSEIQKKGFNYPFQLGNGVKFDDPSVAHEIKVTVRTGDMIVMDTDGLFDNAHNIEFEKLACDGLADLHELGTFSKILARKIEEYALQNSESKSIYTPFAIDCLKVGKDGVGGKSDDITVIGV
ncbi:hypothetical protein KY290_021033 [Solanum tuberosum]|uniref:Protein phosphatase n=1 Tax=Solanum tuberosum TaxID=4113 RepID=A0ABQ7V3G2_SOLTU|nr:hypothetical protein KY289_020217 [Solanum tuberosum]KAH0692880.1 hypothetical protein KY285_019977 [Solanum tuberosum]KAH0757540.1 hypothetical protein KY290_021033 [Solanum tuberosum]